MLNFFNFKKISFAVSCVLLDQLFKLLATQERLYILGSVFNSTFYNKFISWSIPLSTFLIWIFIFIAIVFLLHLAHSRNYPYSLLLIIAGAIGNIIDRWRVGAVIDFISIPLPFHLPFIGNNFPTFNLADAFITFGVLWFLWEEFNYKHSVSANSSKR